ncbi:MAG: SUMF1/EgtB/PvdO family nonheme iron enzyme [Planctomycetota bacterium]
MKMKVFMMLVVGILLAFNAGTQAVTIDLVTVGDAENTSDLTGYGRVKYVYQIGTYEVTNSQYCEFLNTVAAVDDPHELYNTDMAGGWNDIGGITRSGSPGNYTYAVRTNRGNRPVNYVSWFDTLRFANWLHNGQGSGDTEDGAYDMSLGASVRRKTGANFWLPNEDEWYKAAYYKGGGTNAGYWSYPTASHQPPTAELPPGTDLVNGSANHYNDGYLDTTYYTTEVGAYSAKPTTSAYGTFDQAGNLWEWNETPMGYPNRCTRGGSFLYYPGSIPPSRSSVRPCTTESVDYYYIGFRVAAIPEPATLLFIGLGGLALLRKSRA